MALSATSVSKISAIILLILALHQPTWAKRRVPVSSPRCRSSEKNTYCDNVVNYPTALMKSKLKLSSAEFVKRYGGDYGLHKLEKLPDPNEKRICKSVNELYFPKAAANTQNQWKFIVNFDQYIQGVQIEKCRIEGGECEEIKDNLPFGFVSKCRQLYITRSLLSMNTNDPEPKVDKFRMPSACVCYLKREDFRTLQPDDKFRTVNFGRRPVAPRGRRIAAHPA